MVAAKRALRGERRRLLAEARAFETFLDAVDDVPVATSPTTGGGQFLVGSGADRSGAAAVRRAYEDTVMDVFHYAADYDDTYPDSIAAEFGPDVASALLAGPFTDLCKRAVRTAASDARDRRTRFLATLDDERHSLEVAERPIRQLSTGLESLAASSSSRDPFDDRDAVRSTLVTMERRCKSVAADRQEAIQEHALTGSWRVDTSHVQEYLYADLESTYPVLATVADILSRIERRYECDERPLARA
ncbi:hypothetical protein Halru_0686 [Halovivax ruber XH-70]|uniref:DUF7260 domain-containing protein n=2 Tax=Halovivax ruber TaxID=387341 RepID=L0I944_HALRX|nr:hypothetical protein Halru_0686 [Halovivax ruber XH-70]